MEKRWQKPLRNGKRMKEPKDFQDYLFKVLDYHHKEEDKLKKKIECIQSNLNEFIRKLTVIRTSILLRYNLIEEHFYVDQYELIFSKGEKECSIFIFFDNENFIMAHCYTDSRVFESDDCQKIIDWFENI